MNQSTLVKYPFTKIKWIGYNEKEYIGRCPFCGDSTKNTHTGHLYISRHYPIFKCFRCNQHGKLEKLENFINEKCQIEYSNIVQYELPKLDIHKVLDEVDSLLRASILSINSIETEYFRKRCKLKQITPESIIKFGLLSNEIASKYLNGNYVNNTNRTWTIRGLGTAISGRAHDSNSIRYFNQIINECPWLNFIKDDCYFIRSKIFKNINKFINIQPKHLIVAEGIYDIVPLYLHRAKYFIDDIDNDSIFMAAQSSAYDKCLKVYKVLFNSIPKNITIFADNGISLEHLKKQFSNIDSNITINWPMIKDWEECGAIKLSINL